MKNHVVNELRSAGMSGVEAEHAFNEVTDAMARVVKRGDRVRIPGIGIITKKRRKETTRRNPRTGESMTIAPYDVVTIRKPERF
jgi:DNA-binding protein HU-beta